MILILTSLFFSALAEAAPCCSSQSSIPSLISGDNRGQIGLSTSHTSIIGDAPETGPAVFRSSARSELTDTLKLHSAWILTDRFQAGFSVPFVQHQIDQKENHRAIGDVQFSGAYEALPEWSYSEWRPKAIVFLQTTAPTGRSVYESQKPLASDVSGKGFWALQMGALLSKTWGLWDWSLTPEIHTYLGRTFEAGADQISKETITVGAGWGTSLALGGGYSFKNTDWRLGFRVQPSTQFARTTTTVDMVSKSVPQKVWDTSIEAGYLWSDDWNGVASYNDQTLLGPAQNTTLGRTFALMIQRHFSR